MIMSDLKCRRPHDRPGRAEVAAGRGKPTADRGASLGVRARDDLDADLMARLAVALVYAAPLILLVTLPTLGCPLHRWLDPRVTAWLHLALATPVVFWCGLPNLERGLAAARRRPFSREPLIAGATIMAFLSGASASAAPWLLPDGLRYHHDLAGVGCGLATALVIVCLAGKALRWRPPGTAPVVRARSRSG